MLFRNDQSMNHHHLWITYKVERREMTLHAATFQQAEQLTSKIFIKVDKSEITERFLFKSKPIDYSISRFRGLKA